MIGCEVPAMRQALLAARLFHAGRFNGALRRKVAPFAGAAMLFSFKTVRYLFNYL